VELETALFQTYRNPFLMIGTALIVFPKLALGLSGFETGVVVMPLVRGDRDLSEEELEAYSFHAQRARRYPNYRAACSGRIHNTRKLLTTAALDHEFAVGGEQHCHDAADSR
jgi:hypothetical protein